MTSAQRLQTLINTSRSVFSSQDIQMLWRASTHNTKTALKRMEKRGLLFKIAKGYYSTKQDFNIYELANLIISPSYISLDSALFYQGICFQLGSQVTSVAQLTYQRTIKGIVFEYHSMKHSLFFNLEGINIKENLAIARPERAILDSFYLGFSPTIDNFEKINPSYIKELSQGYPKTVQKKLKNLLK